MQSRDVSVIFGLCHDDVRIKKDWLVVFFVPAWERFEIGFGSVQARFGLYLCWIELRIDLDGCRDRDVDSTLAWE